MPILLCTTEIRWFKPGEIPTEIHGWFTELGNPQQQVSRIDRYMPDVHPKWGIKLREGRLEIKFRRQYDGVLVLSEGIEGKMESWVKWGFQLPFDRPSWIPVQKDRQILYFMLDEQGMVELSTPGVMPSGVGGVELTQVWLNEEPWWTIGIEVFGIGGRSPDVVEKIARFVFEGFPSGLSAGQSFSYPILLSEF